MPAFDGTGPVGAGPKTGWGRGNCAAGAGVGQATPRGGFSRGLGRGGAPWGGGRGRCFGGQDSWWGRSPASNTSVTSSDDIVERLRDELAKAQKTVQEMEGRLAELEKSR